MKTVNPSGAKEELVLTQDEIAHIASFRKLRDQDKVTISRFTVTLTREFPREDRPRFAVINGGQSQ